MSPNKTIENVADGLNVHKKALESSFLSAVNKLLTIQKRKALNVGSGFFKNFAPTGLILQCHWCFQIIS